jgi:hypothetical protein
MRKPVFVISGTMFLLSLLMGCTSSSKEWDFPFAINPDRTLAYYAEDTLEIYLAGERDVLAIQMVLPEESAHSWRMQISPGGKNRIIHSTGPDVASYVLPSGPVVPFPADGSISRNIATQGAIVCINPPILKSYFMDLESLLFLEDVQFGGGQLFNSGPRKVKTAVWPP